MAFTINQLQKEIRRNFIPAQRGFPGYPGVPSRPERTVTRRVTTCTGGGTFLTNTPTDDRGLALPGSSNSVSGYVTYGETCTTRTVSERIPAQAAIPSIPPSPPTPAQTVLDYQMGWNAKAHSIEALREDGAFRFRVPRETSGAIVGFSPDPRDRGYNDILYGFYVADGAVSVIESGQVVGSFGTAPNAVLTIARMGGRIIYQVGSTVVRERANAPVPMFLTAAMYMGGDTVEDAEFTDYASASAEFPAMVGYASEATEAAQAVGEFSPMEGAAYEFFAGSASGSFLPMIGAASESADYAASFGEFSPMTGEAESTDLLPEYSVADGAFLGMTAVIGEAFIQPTMNAEGEFLPLIGTASDFEYNFAQGEFSPMVGYAADEPADEAVIFSPLFTLDATVGESILFAVIDGNMTITGLMVVDVLNMAEIASSMTLNGNMTVLEELIATIQSFMDVNVNLFDGQTADTKQVWALHMDAGGSTRYENYDFNSFAKINGKYYGCKADGIYLLEGADDDGEDVESRINFGQIDFGTVERKAMPYVYVGIASDGRLRLKVVADGSTYFYNLRSTPPVLKAERFELGRGLRASYYELEMIDVGGATFELSEIEFFPVKLSRRL